MQKSWHTCYSKSSTIVKTRIIRILEGKLFPCLTRKFSNLELYTGSQGVLSSPYIINDSLVHSLTEQNELVRNEPCKRVNDFASIHLKWTSTIKDISTQGDETRDKTWLNEDWGRRLFFFLQGGTDWLWVTCQVILNTCTVGSACF